jgi:hypothetical protein
MEIIQLADDFPIARGSRIEFITTDAVSTSDPTGTTQARFYGVPRWALSLVSPQVMDEYRAGQWKGLSLRLLGAINRVAAFDPSRPEPLGTLRGALTLSAPVAQGDVSAQISAGAVQAGRTVTIGDFFGLGEGYGTSQLVCAVQGSVVDGAGKVVLHFAAPARRAYAAGTVVVWSRPRAYFQRLQGRAGWGAYSRKKTNTMSIDLVEDVGA